MQFKLNLIDVSIEPEDYGRYPVLVESGGGKREISAAHYYHPPGQMQQGWFDSTGYDAKPVKVIAWAHNK